MSEVLFSRCQPFGNAAGSHGAEGDLLVSITRNGEVRKLSVRIHRDALSKISWLVGDHIIAGVDGDRVSLRRVRGPNEGGVKIGSVNGDTGHGVARFSASEDVLAKAVPEGRKFRASLAEFDGGQAVFIKA